MMEFYERLIELRKKRGLNQNELSEKVGIHVNQIKRYEKGTSQPTLTSLKQLALVLDVSVDRLVFSDEELGPGGELRVQFEALKNLDAEDRQAIKVLLDSVILRHQAKQWTKAG